MVKKVKKKVHFEAIQKIDQFSSQKIDQGGVHICKFVNGY